MRRAVLLALLSCLLRAEEKIVTITATAVDAAGKPIPDLRASDFQLSIDGRPRPVLFSRFEGNKTAHSATLLLLDLLNDRTMTGQEIIDTAIDAIKGLETNDDLYLYILSARAQVVPIHAAPKVDSEPPAADNTWTRHVESLLRDAFKNLFSLRSQGDSDVVTRLSITSQAMLELAHAMKPIPGRKNLVWVSHGIPLCGSSRQDDEVVELTVRLRRVCEELQQAQIAVYPVMQSARGAAGASGVEGVQDIEEIADLTGGRKYGSSYVREAVRQAIADSRATYRLAYSAPDAKPDTKYHRIRVSTARPDVRVQARGGYYMVDPLTPPSQAAQTRLELASRSPYDSSTIRLRGSVARLPASPQSIRIDLNVDPADLFLRDSGNLRTGSIAIWFTAFDSKGWNQPASPGPVEVRLPPEKSEIEFHQPLRVNAGAKKVRAIVVDRELGSIGTVTMDVP